MTQEEILEGNRLIAEFRGYIIYPNVATFDDSKSLTEQWNNDSKTYVHTPKGKGQEWYKVEHRGLYYQLFTDFTFSQLSEDAIELRCEKPDTGLFGDSFLLQDAKFHLSWDWLLPVILEVNGKHSPLVLFHPYDILKEFEVTVGRIKLRNKALKTFK